MKTFAVAVIFAVCAVVAQAGSFAELLKRLSEEIEDRSLYMIKTKDGGITGDVQTTNSDKCSKGCVFEVKVTDWSSQQLAAPVQLVTYPGQFKFEGLDTNKVYQVKACPQLYPKDCGTLIYCTFNTGAVYTTNHQCSTDPPRDPNAVINKIRELLHELEN